jgi:UPF0755 protein
MTRAARKSGPKSKPAPKRGVLGWLVRVFLLGLVVAAVAGWFAYEDYRRFVATELSLGEQEQVLEVKRGDSFDHVLARMRRLGISEGHDVYWKALAWEQGVITRLQVGEYALGHGMTPSTLLAKLEQGRVIQHRFTVVEGWNFRELRLALAAETALEQTLPGLPDEEVMRRLGAGGEHPEGRFLPETYHYTRGISDLDLLKRTYLAMRGALDAAWEKRQPDLPISTPYEALVLASIIEKETGVARERPEIAGVFVRRLRLGMKLQTDPTVIYGLGASFDGNLTRNHLQTPTPWNTYTQFGLPPTPIALPGRAAIEAALDPAPGEALYFVSRGDGSHVFSKTLAEHNRAVVQYQLRRR